jgi:hypothetical protein
MTISKPLHFFFGIAYADACVPIAFYKSHGHLVHLSRNFRRPVRLLVCDVHYLASINFTSASNAS